MKNKFLSIPFIIILLWACTAPITISKVPPQSDAAAAAFEKAESLFRQQSYEEALESYSQYLSRFSNGRSADFALKRIATINGLLGDQDAKLETCRRLTSEYPDSPYTPSANYEIMTALYNEGKSQEVILRASAIIKKSDSKELLLGTYSILGDTYVSLGSPVEAVYFYNLAFTKSDSSQKEIIINKLKGIVNLLSQKDVTKLSGHLKQDSVKSHLIYQIALMEYERENYEEAEKAFLKFLEEFPRHKDAEHAKLLVEKINQRTAFRRELIGCMLPLSGPYEALGNRALKAIRLALECFNSLNGKPGLQLVVRDTGSDPALISHLVQELDEARVALIIGSMVTSREAAIEAQKSEIPIITLTQKTGIPDIGEYVFRNFLTPEIQVEALLACAIEQFGAGRFAILYPNETYGESFMELFRDRAEYYGADVVGIASYAPDQTDFSSPIKRLAKISEAREEQVSAPHRLTFNGKDGLNTAGVALDFDAIFIPDEHSKAALIAPQLAYWDVNHVLLMGTNLWHSDRLIEIARDYVQNAILADVYYAQSANKTVQNFIRSFEELYGDPPGPIEGLAYDTAMIAFQTSANPDVRSRIGIKDRLKEIYNFDGATGLTSFKANGDVQKRLYLLQISGVDFVELKQR
jgi:ABC-type branched-subunit amino acid transport system substrate-binding protein/TolA-binding protein